MRTVRVIRPGLFTTVQDLGRPGWSAIGVPEGGAADRVSARVGNRLVGNADGAAALEVALGGAEFEFDEPVMIALAGADVEAAILGAGQREARMWRATALRGGERVRIGATSRGARVYVCVGGGVDVPRVLGSRSTHAASGLGGHEGRALRAGDCLAIGAARGAARLTELDTEAARWARSVIERRVLRVTASTGGVDHAMRCGEPSRITGVEAFEGRAAFEKLGKATFSVASQSDRMGVRLEGARVRWDGGERRESEGTAWGTIQIPGDGRPIVLMADRPTTGGYAVVGCVASVDHAALGQCRPRDAVRFEAVTLEEARRLVREQEAALDRFVPKADDGRAG